jgi:hypothetical protein
MTPVIVRYPLDPTGINLNNLVQGETHEMVRRKVRAIATIYGAFFSESLKVVDFATQQELIAGTQFIAAEMYELPTQRYGKEVCAIILILDESVGDKVSLQYQAVGGEFSSSFTAITQMLEDLALDERALGWTAIVDRPTEFPPSHHFHDAGDTYGWESILHALDKVRSAIAAGDRLSHDAIYRYIDNANTEVSDEVANTINDVVNSAITAHVAEPDPHTQYFLKADASQISVAAVRKPDNISPASGELSVAVNLTLTSGPFHSLYDLTQTSAQFQLSVNPGCVAPFVFDTTLNSATQSYAYPTPLEGNTIYYWRVRYRDIENVWSAWSTVTQFTSSELGVAQPTLTSPVNGAIVNTNGTSLTSSVFTVNGTSDSHVSSDWEIWTGPDGNGVKVFSSLADTTNKLSIAIAPGVLNNNATYYPRVRHRGVNLGVSIWSATKSFSVNYPLAPTVIGEAFGGGYFAGNFTTAGNTYAVIVAPKASGQTSMQLSQYTNDVGATSRTNSTDNTDRLVPGNKAAVWVKALNIAGFVDWKIPAINVMQIIWNALRPGAASAPVIFKTGGVEAFTASNYWTSTQYNYSETMTIQGDPIYGNKTYSTKYTSEYMGWENDVGATPTPVCPTAKESVSGVSYGYFFTINPVTNQPDDKVYATYTCSYTEYGIIGYNADTTYTDYYYNGYYISFSSTSYIERNASKTNQMYVRAVRMVLVS